MDSRAATQTKSSVRRPFFVSAEMWYTKGSFGRDADAPGAYAMSPEDALAVVEDASRDPNLAGLHVVSGLHPTWTFEDYLSRLRLLHERFPKLYIKGFTGVEITHFAKISGLSIREVLLRLRDEGGLQDETGGFLTFICFPFLPKNTKLGKTVKQTSMWDDLRTMAVSRLVLDNFPHIKAYWVMLTLPVAQIALGFGADDIDGTVHKETILHDAGATSPTALTENQILRVIREAGRIPATCDCNYHILKRCDKEKE